MLRTEHVALQYQFRGRRALQLLTIHLEYFNVVEGTTATRCATTVTVSENEFGENVKVRSSSGKNLSRVAGRSPAHITRQGLTRQWFSLRRNFKTRFEIVTI